MPRRTGSPARPIACSAKPTSRATNSVCSTEPPVSAEKSVVGMIPSRKSTVRRSALGAPAPGRLAASSSVEVQARAGLDDVADDQADRQRDGRHRQEVAERQPADLADLGGLPHRADAEHDRAEDDRADHHLDQVDEAGAERLELTPNSGQTRPTMMPSDDGDDDGDVELVGAVPLRARRLRSHGALSAGRAVSPGAGLGVVPGGWTAALSVPCASQGHGCVH